ncbi:MAG: efflux RND transporter periplasmic adaptor subunit [Acidobacteriaceae bacterium]
MLVAVAAGLALYIYLHNRRDEVEVRAARAEPQTITQTKSTNARVEPVDNFDAHAPLAGTVDNIYVHLNQKVEAGQELLRMDDTDARKDLATAEASLASSEALLQTMEQGGTKAERLVSTGDIQTAKIQVQQDSDSLAALEKLQTQGAASANEVAQAQHVLTVAEARLTQAQAQTGARYSGDDLKAQRAQVAETQAAVNAAKAVYAGVDIHAPFAGTVYSVPVTQYQFVPAGEALIQLANLRKMQITAYFDEPEIGQLKAGQPVTIVWSAKPGAEWHGHVVEAPTTIIAYGGTRNVGECLISVDDANGVLLPNTTVTVTVTENRRENVLSLPREALHTEGPEGMSDYVYRIVDHHLVRTRVVVGLINLQRFEVVSGVKQGELVALGATTEVDLSDGLRVKVHP